MMDRKIMLYYKKINVFHLDILVPDDPIEIFNFIGGQSIFLK